MKATSTQQILVPHIPENAPFSPEQRAWLNGMFAGMYSSAAVDSAAMIDQEQSRGPSVTIFWGSQTGTAESLAKQTSKHLKSLGCDVCVVDMVDAKIESLKSIENLLIITSTYGEGDPPDNAIGFHQAIMTDGIEELSHLNYAVFGLGDSNYVDFCQCSREFDNRFSALGAKPLFEAIECDGDPEELFSDWKLKLSESLSGDQNSPGTAVEVENDSENAEIVYSKKNPFPAKIKKSINLNGEGSSKATHHVEILLEGSGLKYEAGDALGIYPKNCHRYVDTLLTVLSLDGNEEILNSNQEKSSLRKILIEDKEIGSLNPGLVKRYAEICKHEELVSILSDKDKLSAFLWGKDLIDLCTEFPATFKGNSRAFLDLLKPIGPRLYSISSSPKAHYQEVHLTVGKVEYESGGRIKKGVCSSYLADCVATDSVEVFVHQNNAFRLPQSDEVSVIMIGPGTGIAPFRAFLEEREQRKAAGKNWLFFGDQHVQSDFLYQEQLDGWLKTGLLTRLDVAFSRDQKEKIYVQDRMHEMGAEFYQWIEQGASIYVCGDASRMAKDVDQAIHQIIEQYGKLDPEGSVDFVQRLKKEKRYLRDVY